MSLYQLNKIMFLLEVDSMFLANIRADAADAIKDMDLTTEERAAVLAGDVGTLYLMGVHMFLLDSLTRHQLLGVNRENYLLQVRAAAEKASKAGKPDARAT
jgi:hypothetical protein